MQALILTDLQYDFLPGGALAVPRGDEVIPVANRLSPHFDFVITTQDWHPPEHKSFASNHPGHNVGETIDVNGLDQYLWPDHCIQGTHGAQLAAELNTNRIDKIVRKAEDPEIDSYSAFYDNGHRKATAMKDYLQDNQVNVLYCLGLATDYCVKFTVLDALNEGYPTWLVTDGCRGIEARPGDIDQALREMQDAGAQFVESREICE